MVGVGASAGGLDACKKLIGALPAKTGMAFILVQHLDPAHVSMLVDLLAGHTALSVAEATDGMVIEPEHLYVIPPGAYLAVEAGALRISPPLAHHGARLPFDHLLRSLADDCGPYAIGVILSGTGGDGSAGLQAVKARGGYVIAQDPGEADFDGMPRSAINAGAVDEVLCVGMIAEALIGRAGRLAASAASGEPAAKSISPTALAEIIALLSKTTAHDFRLYKSGTLQRRIERRMAMVAIESDHMDSYLQRLRGDPGEVERLAKDLLINVTGFFRDRKVFALLAETIIPGLVRDRPGDEPLRVWIAGCSTGEETYSLAMLLREAIIDAKRNVKLQIFASDIDADAVAVAREGFYPLTIEADVEPERLARFFTKETNGYRILSELRSMVVFAVQDVLVDPPFARLDMVSCRNLLIYFQPEGQATVLALFHFALKSGGILLLGGAETAGDLDGRFEPISKPERIFRRVGHSRPGAWSFSKILADGGRVGVRPGQARAPLRHAALADLCRQLVQDAYAPAAVLIDRQHECLYSLGPTDRYLRMAPGLPTHDLLAMAREGLRAKLRSAVQQASQANARVVVPGGRVDHDGETIGFSLDVRPVVSEGEDLMLICFVDDPKPQLDAGRELAPTDASRVAEMEQELSTLRTELSSAIRDLELSSEEQKAINEEALSVNEEYQSTNEELLTSKEELQSLNEELTALNSQLQETLEAQRTTSNDLQNVLYSTNVATIFLDRDLKIRFFTPATRMLFNVIPSDIGRPLADLSALAADDTLLRDARTVLGERDPLEREIQASDGAWYMRRILPYLTEGDVVEGVVVTFVDITDQRSAADAVKSARRQAELANMAKTRFLAAASHDLRQPLQTLVLLQGLLAKSAGGEKAQKLLARFDETLGAMSGMLNVLLDINQIDSGAVRPEISAFPVDDLLGRMRDEFSYHAQAQGLALRVVVSDLVVDTDPRLIEQIVRNLLSNALKYTRRGKILLGCRRRDGIVSIEVWDTGIGMAQSELEVIFQEYRQLGNAARERSLGLGLGLSIVQRLARVLGHPVRVRSIIGKGSMFSVEAPRARAGAPARREPYAPVQGRANAGLAPHHADILVVEDDPEVRELLELLLAEEGHRPICASDGPTAIGLVAKGAVRPDLILADFNLPGGLDGLQLAAALRESLHSELPVIILTGDISTKTLRAVGEQNCVHLNKPVKAQALSQVIQRLLPLAVVHSRAPPPAGEGGDPPLIYVVDDDEQVRASIRSVLEDDGRQVEDFADGEAFLAAYQPGRQACVLIDAYLPGMSGLDLLHRLRDSGQQLPAIMITGNSDVAIAVEAMKAGASDFIEKPMGHAELLASVERALERSRDTGKLEAWRQDAADHLARLTKRQREIMERVLAGHPSKNIAADLGVSQRTVENHRAAIMKKTGSKSLPALARLAVAAAAHGAKAAE